jgi:hypothetical protein
LLSLPKEALVDERGYSIRDFKRTWQRGAADCLNGLEGATADKNREPPEEPLLIGI